MQLTGGVVGWGIKKLLGMMNLPWQRFEKRIYKNWIICRHGLTTNERFGDLWVPLYWNWIITRTYQSFIFQLVISIRQGGKKNKVKLTVTYNMIWKKRSSGSIHDSYIGHAFIIGGRSKGLFWMVIYSKACWKFDAAEKRGEEAENLEGSSKSKEASEILKMVEDAFYNCFLIIDFIVINNYSRIRAILNHSPKGSWSQDVKSTKEKLGEEIPETSFLADLSHRVKVLS